MIQKKKLRQEIRKPDIVVETTVSAARWMRDNPRLCALGAGIVVALGVLFFGFRVYEGRKDERVQHLLSDGIRSFQEFNAGGKQESLGKAESAFQSLLKENYRGVSDIARLYLGRISYVKGKSEEAKVMYREVANRASNATLKQLSESALKELEKETSPAAAAPAKP